MMQGVHLVETGQGTKDWELDSESAQGFKEKGTWKLRGVRVKFFGEKGAVYTVDGKTGSFESETKNIHVQGDVVMTTSDGYVFKSDDLTYEGKTKNLWTKTKVKMNTKSRAKERFDMSGENFSANLNTNEIWIRDNVVAVRSIPPDRLMNIKSQWSRIDGKTHAAHFEDQVQVDIENMRMTGDMADFDYNAKTHLLERLFLAGNVKVTDTQHWASSEKAEVLFAKNEFILTGTPKVNQGENQLQGDEIRFINGGKEVRVIKAKAKMDKVDQVQK